MQSIRLHSFASSPSFLCAREYPTGVYTMCWNCFLSIPNSTQYPWLCGLQLAHQHTVYFDFTNIRTIKKNSASKFASTYFKNIFDISKQWVTQSRKIMKYTFPFKNLVCFLKVCKQSCMHRYVKSNKQQKASLCLVLIFN